MKWLVTIATTLLAVVAVVSQGPDPNEAACDELRKKEASIFSEDNTCYFISKEKLNWLGALRSCVSRFMLLAELSTEEEFVNVTGRMQEADKYGQYWFGLNDINQEGKYSYVGSGKPLAYVAGSISHRKDTNNCMTVKVSSKKTSMSDNRCSRLRRFMCAKSQCRCRSSAVAGEGQEEHGKENDENADTNEEQERARAAAMSHRGGWKRINRQRN